MISYFRGVKIYISSPLFIFAKKGGESLKNEFREIQDPCVRPYATLVGSIFGGKIENAIKDPNSDKEIGRMYSKIHKGLLNEGYSPERASDIADKFVNATQHYIIEKNNNTKRIEDFFGISNESAAIISNMGYTTPYHILYDKPSGIKTKLGSIDDKELKVILAKRDSYIKHKGIEIKKNVEQLGMANSIEEFVDLYSTSLEELLYNDMLKIFPEIGDVVNYFMQAAEEDNLYKLSPVTAVERETSINRDVLDGYIDKMDEIEFEIKKVADENEIPKVDRFIDSLLTYANLIAYKFPTCYGIKREFNNILDTLLDALEIYSEGK